MEDNKNGGHCMDAETTVALSKMKEEILAGVALQLSAAMEKMEGHLAERGKLNDKNIALEFKLAENERKRIEADVQRSLAQSLEHYKEDEVLAKAITDSRLSMMKEVEQKLKERDDNKKFNWSYALSVLSFIGMIVIGIMSII